MHCYCFIIFTSNSWFAIFAIFAFQKKILLPSSSGIIIKTI